MDKHSLHNVLFDFRYCWNTAQNTWSQMPFEILLLKPSTEYHFNFSLIMYVYIVHMYTACDVPMVSCLLIWVKQEYRNCFFHEWLKNVENKYHPKTGCWSKLFRCWFYLQHLWWPTYRSVWQSFHWSIRWNPMLVIHSRCLEKKQPPFVVAKCKISFIDFLIVFLFL